MEVTLKKIEAIFKVNEEIVAKINSRKVKRALTLSLTLVDDGKRYDCKETVKEIPGMPLLRSLLPSHLRDLAVLSP